jgi:hypothetical protein
LKQIYLLQITETPSQIGFNMREKAMVHVTEKFKVRLQPRLDLDSFL